MLLKITIVQRISCGPASLLSTKTSHWPPWLRHSAKSLTVEKVFKMATEVGNETFEETQETEAITGNGGCSTSDIVERKKKSVIWIFFAVHKAKVFT